MFSTVRGELVLLLSAALLVFQLAVVAPVLEQLWDCPPKVVTESLKIFVWKYEIWICDHGAEVANAIERAVQADQFLSTWAETKVHKRNGFFKSR